MLIYIWLLTTWDHIILLYHNITFIALWTRILIYLVYWAGFALLCWKIFDANWGCVWGGYIRVHTALHNPRPRYRSITAATAGIYYLVQAAVSLLLESNWEYWRCRTSYLLHAVKLRQISLWNTRDCPVALMVWCFESKSSCVDTNNVNKVTPPLSTVPLH